MVKSFELSGNTCLRSKEIAGLMACFLTKKYEEMKVSMISLLSITAGEFCILALNSHLVTDDRHYNQRDVSGILKQTLSKPMQTPQCPTSHPAGDWWNILLL